MFWENAKPFIAQETINGFRMKVYYERPRTLYETFEKSVSRYPDKIALVHGSVQVTYQKLKEKWNPSLELHNTYRLTETTSPATIMPDEHQLRKISSVGVVTPVADAKGVDPRTCKELEPNKVGELLFKGPMVIFYIGIILKRQKKLCNMVGY